MIAEPLWQTFLFAVVAALTIVGVRTSALDLAVQITALAAVTAVFGLPHGALDLPIAEALWPLRGWRGRARFFFAYVGLAALVIALWVALPTVAFVAFLAYSALHFAGDWSSAPMLLRWTGGAATVSAPALCHGRETAELFAYLVPAASAELAVEVLAAVGVVAFVVLAGSVVFMRGTGFRAFVEQGVLWISALALQPLVFFMLYFCALHSIRHFHSAIVRLDEQRRAVFISALLSVVVIAVAAYAVVYLKTAQRISIDEGTFRVVFIGLAALTVPHMILVDRFERKMVRA